MHEKCPSLAVLVVDSVWDLKDQLLENLCKSPPDNPDQQYLPNLTSLSACDTDITAEGLRTFLADRKNIAEFTKLAFKQRNRVWSPDFIAVGKEILKR